MDPVTLDSEALFWFMAGLTLLLLTFVVAVVRTHPGTPGSPRPPGPAGPALPPLVRCPPAAALAREAVHPGCTGYRPQHDGAPEPELMAAGRLQMSGGPPWEPAPKPPGVVGSHARPSHALPGQMPGKAVADGAPRPDPGLVLHAGGRPGPADMTGPAPGYLRSAPIARGRALPGGRAGAHRRASRGGAHRAETTTARARRSASPTGRHRAAAHRDRPGYQYPGVLHAMAFAQVNRALEPGRARGGRNLPRHARWPAGRDDHVRRTPAVGVQRPVSRLALRRPARSRAGTRRTRRM